MPLKSRTPEFRAYMKKYMAERYARRRAAAVEQLGGKCVVCGTRDWLEFDHVDASQKNHGLNFAGMSEAKLQAELKKCQLLCHEHHLVKNKLDAAKRSMDYDAE